MALVTGGRKHAAEVQGNQDVGGAGISHKTRGGTPEVQRDKFLRTQGHQPAIGGSQDRRSSLENPAATIISHTCTPRSRLSKVSLALSHGTQNELGTGSQPERQGIGCWALKIPKDSSTTSAGIMTQTNRRRKSS